MADVSNDLSGFEFDTDFEQDKDVGSIDLGFDTFEFDSPFTNNSFSFDSNDFDFSLDSFSSPLSSGSILGAPSDPSFSFDGGNDVSSDSSLGLSLLADPVEEEEVEKKGFDFIDAAITGLGLLVSPPLAIAANVAKQGLTRGKDAAGRAAIEGAVTLGLSTVLSPITKAITGRAAEAGFNALGIGGAVVAGGATQFGLSRVTRGLSRDISGALIEGNTTTERSPSRTGSTLLSVADTGGTNTISDTNLFTGAPVRSFPVQNFNYYRDPLLNIGKLI